MNLDFLKAPRSPQPQWVEKGRRFLQSLTMPPWAMGDLLDLALRLIGLQQTLQPCADRFITMPFCADHGVARPEITNSPRRVSTMVALNMAKGDATVARLTTLYGGTCHPVDMGLASHDHHPNLAAHKIDFGTADWTKTDAMSEPQLIQAIQTGYQLALDADAQLLIAGEMGVGNTSTATALYCALTGQDPQHVTGLGSGIDETKRHKKIDVIQQGLTRHADATEPIEKLRRLGGFEIGAMVGFFIGGAVGGKIMLIDGFIAATAALYACALRPTVIHWLFATHLGAEPGQKAAYEKLGLEPYMNFNLKLGEGAGAVLAVPHFRAACELCRLPTFEQSQIPAQIGDDFS